MIKSKIQYNILCCFISFVLLISGSAAVVSNGNDISETYTNTEVYLGGMPFGVRFSAGEVTVVRTNPFVSSGVEVSPAEEAGIIANDIITNVNGKNVSSINDIVDAVNRSNGTPIAMVLQRGQKEFRVSLTPKKCDNSDSFRLGVMLKDSSAGIGTVTFVEPESHVFAGLGHGICDSESGAVLKIDSGYISNVEINGINKGKSGSPGELRGNLDSDKCGKLLRNTEVGVYGIFTEPPALPTTTVTIAKMEDVKVGKASILCTLDENQIDEYAIEICEINHNTAAKTKNYVVKVTDARLLAKTGGIVQGMSGSPILQNGKLIGAITHVMIHDPTTGYGIYIGNMLDEMKTIL